MRPLILALVGLLASAAVSAQAPTAFDSSKAWEHLRQQVAIGPRPSGSAGNLKNREYITKTLAAIGLKTVEQAWEAMTPLGPIKMVNLIATIPSRRPERIILASHFDTKLFREFRFVGASDGASSTATLLELARVLKARPQLPFTIELLFLDGEEATGEWRDPDHTYGSRHYVEVARQTGTLKSLKAMILLDMVGDRQLNIRRESTSTPWLTDIIWNTARRLGAEQSLQRGKTKPALWRVDQSVQNSAPGSPSKIQRQRPDVRRHCRVRDCGALCPPL